LAELRDAEQRLRVADRQRERALHELLAEALVPCGGLGGRHRSRHRPRLPMVQGERLPVSGDALIPLSNLISAAARPITEPLVIPRRNPYGRYRWCAAARRLLSGRRGVRPAAH